MLAHDLGPNFRIRIGLVDPVSFGRPQQRINLVQRRNALISVPYGPKFGTLPANVVADVNYYETIGQPAQFLALGKVVAGEPIAGFNNHNVTSEFMKDGFAHVDIVHEYGPIAASFAFQSEAGDPGMPSGLA